MRSLCHALARATCYGLLTPFFAAPRVAGARVTVLGFLVLPVIAASTCRPMGPAATLMSPPSVTFASREKAFTDGIRVEDHHEFRHLSTDLEAEACPASANG